MALPASGQPVPRSSDRFDLRQKAIRYLSSAPPGEFSIISLLKEIGATRATLYRTFQSDGGLRAYDRKRRLGLVHRSIVDGDTRTVTEIGASLGFGDPANLARQFQRRYGYTITQLRGLLSAPRVAPQSNDTLHTYREAVRSLSME